MREVVAHMEKIGEKHAFFEKRKCGSRKVLRFMRSLLYALTVLSLPLRGAWIEIPLNSSQCFQSKSLPLRGAWIEIKEQHQIEVAKKRRSPCGERGLKYIKPNIKEWDIDVAPPAGSVD